MLFEFLINPIINFCYRRGYTKAAEILTQIKNEPMNHLYWATTYPLGWLPRFNFYGLNPSALTPIQAKSAAVLYLHGLNANQSSGLTIGKEFQKDFPGTVFTLNLQNKVRYCQEDFASIEEKITEIKALYKKYGNNNPTIHLIGHSRGATVAYYVSIEPAHWKLNSDQVFELRPEVSDGDKREIKYRDQIGKVAFFGGGRTPYGYSDYDSVRTKFLCIEGRADNTSPLDAEHTEYVENSHRTTVYHPQAIAKTLQFFVTKTDTPMPDTVRLNESEDEKYSGCAVM